MSEPEFLELDTVLFLHDYALREYGGIHGLRSPDLLHSALDRPRNRFAYAETGSVDLNILAAAYVCGIVGNHPFNDGNERTAWGSCVLLLKVNDAGIRIPAPEVVETMVALTARQISEAEFALWLAAHRA